MTSSFVSPPDRLTSFLGISLSRALSSLGLPVYSSIHSRRITNAHKSGHYGRVVFPKLAEAAGNARGVPNGGSLLPVPCLADASWLLAELLFEFIMCVCLLILLGITFWGRNVLTQQLKCNLSSSSRLNLRTAPSLGQ